MSGNEKDDGVDGAAVAKSLDELLDRRERNFALNFRVSMPARIVSYDPITQLATARGEFLPIKAVGDEDVPDIPILFSGIPVAWSAGTAGGSWSAFPILPDDTGHVLVMDRALTLWLTSGNPVAATDPRSGRAHNLADAIFVPGLHPHAGAIAPTAPMDAHVIQGPLVRLGATTAAEAEFVMLGTTLASELTAIVATLSGLPAAAGPDAVTINGNTANLISALTAMIGAVSAKVQAGR